MLTADAGINQGECGAGECPRALSAHWSLTLLSFCRADAFGFPSHTSSRDLVVIGLDYLCFMFTCFLPRC